MVMFINVYTQQKVGTSLFDQIRSYSDDFSVLQRELYNILVNEDAQQVLLTPDPSQYK